MKKTMVAAALVAATGFAQADTISYNFMNALQTTEINQTGTLGLFDLSLGTLTGIVLNVFGEGDTLITLNNRAAQQQKVSAIGAVNLDFSSSLTGLNSLFAGLNSLITMNFPTGTQTIGAGASYTSPLLTDSGTMQFSSELTSLLSEFGKTGGGNFTVTCESLSGIGITGGGGNIGSQQATHAACGASVQYTYDAVVTPPVSVPEPASLALVGLGLLGVSTLRRRKSA